MEQESIALMQMIGAAVGKLNDLPTLWCLSSKTWGSAMRATASRRRGQTYRLRHNPAHRWFYFPDMRRDEALVFKVFDSAKDGRARFTAHTSFVDPATPPGAPARQSIEARALAFF